jgi:hypothetical protein
LNPETERAGRRVSNEESEDSVKIREVFGFGFQR